MKKTVYTLIVDDYAPNLTKFTIPLMRRYAEKINADFYIIKDRKYPEMPPVYEKFQIKELSKIHKNDWNFFFDADALIHPDFWDVTSIVTKDITISNGSDFLPIRFEPDHCHFRDGRMIGKGNWCLIASDWCTDIWSPLEDITFEDAVSRIHPTVGELNTVVKPEHLIDDFVVSRNISRFGLKHILIPELSQKVKAHPEIQLYHLYVQTLEQKEFLIKKTLMTWAMSGLASEVNPDAVNALNIIQSMNWERDKEKDWEEIMTLIPYGKKIAKTINSWGIDVKPREIDNLSVLMKKELMFIPIANLPESQEKIITAAAIRQWDGSTKWDDLLSALPFGQHIMDHINKVGGNVETKNVTGIKLGEVKNETAS
jgi:hypothetical protein